MKNRALEFGATVWISILIVVVIAIISTGVAMLRPAWLGWERESVTQSQSYVDARQRELLQWADEYRKLDVKIVEAKDNADAQAAYKAQRNAVLARMKQAAGTLPAQVIPAEAKIILDQEGTK